RRSRLTSQSVGLPEGRRRRVAGLRREEVAVLADVGITWYTWLEQGRPIRMAPATLDRICDALRLDRDERAYLHRLVFFTADEASWKVPVPERIADVIRSYTAGPAYVRGARWDLLAWNAAFEHTFGFTGSSPERNSLRHSFLDPNVQRMTIDWDVLARQLVASFRPDYAQHAGDDDFEALVAELRRESPTFARLWSDPDVLSPTASRSIRLRHPELGTVLYDSVSLLIPDMPHLTVVFGTIRHHPCSRRARRL
ncbi:MAG TPA: helix-turn-helix transcriptional regulator, partial [Candidatus Elarobacter sp.]|nr:helix-turn-helix transcriptional regulator [Candidatus Elarobacter sp.]